MNKLKHGVCLIVLITLSGLAFCQNISPVLNIISTTEEIKIDGRLNETVWDNAQEAKNFWGTWPNDTVPSILKTTVKIAYDDKNIYVAAICYGKAPYVVQTLKRDQNFFESDGFSITLDPQNTKSNGYIFGVNAYGGEMDVLFNASYDWNDAWDSKWYSHVTRTDDRWVLEMAIPLKTIRYNYKNTSWGINFCRNDINNNQYSTWAPVPQNFWATDLGYLGLLKWEQEPPRSKTNTVINPYVGIQSSADFENNEYEDINLTMGLDAKTALSSSLNLDLTINPDYSQIDVDDQQINLTQYSLFFPEKRGFFLENSDLFTSFGTWDTRPFYSRNIGLNDGSIVPILYGARLTGNITPKCRIGLMNTQTRKTENTLAQNYTIAAIQQRFWKRSSVRVMFSNAQFNDKGEFLKEESSQNTGAEFELISKNGQWTALLKSHLSDSPFLKVDREFHSVFLGLSKKKFIGNLEFNHVGKNFQTDMGFSRRQWHYDASADNWKRVGYNQAYSYFQKNYFPKKKKSIIQHGPIIENNILLTFDKKISNRESSLFYYFDFKNRQHIKLQFSSIENNLLYPLNITDEELLPAEGYHFNYLSLYFHTDDRKKIWLNNYLEKGGFFNGTKTSLSPSVKFRIQPLFNLQLGVQYNEIKLPDPYGNAKFWLANLKFEFNFRKNLFWTTYLQYNTQADNFNVNSRFQWRLKPMSDLFLVYSDNYLDHPILPKNRSVVLRFNYWFSL